MEQQPASTKKQLKLYPHQIKVWNSKRRIIAFVGGTGSGKCVKASERILLANGSRVQAIDLVGRDSFELLASSPDGTKKVTATAELNSISEPIWELVTETGKRLSRNAEHPLWTATTGRLNGRNRRISVHGWTPISEVVPGDVVAVADSVEVESQVDRSDDELKLLAYLIGDGCLTKPGNVTFTQTAGFQLNEFAVSASNLGCWLNKRFRPYDYGVVANRAGGDLSVRVENKVMSLVRDAGLEGSNSHTKRIPDFIFALSRVKIAIFLSRLYSTDGWAYAPKSPAARSSSPQIGYCSVSRELVEDIQLLLLYWGIQSRIEVKRSSYTLTVAGAMSRIRFAEHIGIFGKKEAVARVVAKDLEVCPNNNGAWRSLELNPGLRWERVRSVKLTGNAPTVSIEIDSEDHEYLSVFREHNTWLGARWVVRRLLSQPGNRVLCIGMGYERHVSRVMIHEVKSALNDWNVPFRVNEKKAEILLTQNGSQALFGSADNPLSLEGPHLPDCWMDEAGLFPRLAWEVAQRRTGHANGQILITTIPYFEGWLKDSVWAPAVHDKDPDIDWLPCKTTDNLGYSRKEIERARKTMRADKFDRYYNGNWAKPIGLIWPDPADSEIVVDPAVEFAWNDGSPCSYCHGEICRGQVPCDWPAFSAHDWGWNDPTTGVWARLSNDDVLYIVADYEQGGLTIDDHIEAWRERGLLNVDASWGDPAAPEIWERANELGYPVTKAHNSVEAGINAVYARLITGRLKVFKGCKTWLDARMTYRWATMPNDEEVLLDRPLKPQPALHIADATRYLAMGIQEYGQGAQAIPMMSTQRKGTIA